MMEPQVHASPNDSSRTEQRQSNIGTEANDDTFSVPVEWPRAQPKTAQSAPTQAGRQEEAVSSDGAVADSPSPATDFVEDEYSSGEDEDDEKEQSPPDSSVPVKRVKWKLALLFLSSIYELISVITKSQLSVAIFEAQFCFRCYNGSEEDLYSALFVPVLMFYIFFIMKEAQKVVSAFALIFCVDYMGTLFCSDDTVWPRNMLTIPMYFLKPNEIVKEKNGDYDYEYSQTHTLMNLFLEDLPYFIFGIYARRLEIKSAGFVVLISFIGTFVSVVEAVWYVRRR